MVAGWCWGSKPDPHTRTQSLGLGSSKQFLGTAGPNMGLEQGQVLGLCPRQGAQHLLNLCLCNFILHGGHSGDGGGGGDMCTPLRRGLGRVFLLEEHCRQSFFGAYRSGQWGPAEGVLAGELTYWAPCSSAVGWLNCGFHYEASTSLVA